MKHKTIIFQIFISLVLFSSMCFFCKKQSLKNYITYDDEIVKAINTGDLNKVKFYLNQVDVNASDSLNFSLLMYASVAGEYEIVNLLIQKGAKVNIRSYNGYNPLIYTLSASKITDNHIKIINLLLENRAKVNEQDRFGDSPLLIASFRGSISALETLLKYQPNINISDFSNKNALMKIAGIKDFSDKYLQIAELLIRKNINVNGQDKFGFTPLIEAVINSNIRLVKLLLKSNAHVNLKTKENKTALYFARKAKNKQIIDMLNKAHGVY